MTLVQTSLLLFLSVFVLIVHSQPPNDSCSAAHDINGLPYVSGQRSTVGASTTLFDTLAAPCVPLHVADVWFKYHAAPTRVVDITLCVGTTFDTVLYVLEGSFECDAFFCDRFNDDGCSLQSQMTNVILNSELVYYIVIAGLSGSGDYTLRINLASSIPAPPANNVCSGAISIPTQLPFQSPERTTLGATHDTVLSLPCSDPFSRNAPDVWYSYVPAKSIRVTISTCGSSFNTFLYLLKGTCQSYTCDFVGDNLGCGRGQSKIADAILERGVTYYIIVTGWLDHIGNYKLNLVETPPPNDQCSGAIVISGLPYYSPILNTYSARRDMVVSDPCGNFGTSGEVWFSYTPTATGLVDISLCSTNAEVASFDPTLYFFQGNCQSYSCIASNNDNDGTCTNPSQSKLVGQSVTAGVTYLIAVAGNADVDGIKYRLTVTVRAVPGDECVNAFPIQTLPFSRTVDTTSATRNFLCSGSTSGGVGRDVWFSFTPETTIQHVYISTCESRFNTFLFLVSGSCGNVQCVKSDDESCSGQGGGTNGALISDWTLTGGTQYFIVISGVLATDYGSVTLSVSVDTGAVVNILTPIANVVAGPTLAGNLVISGTSGINDAQGTITITISDTDPETANIPLTTTVGADFTWTASTSILSLIDGTITITVAIVDPSGNQGSSSITIIKDAYASVTISAPLPNSYISINNQNSLIVSGVTGTNDARGAITLTITDTSQNTADIVSRSTVRGDSTWSISGISVSSQVDGVLTVTALVVDLNGNQATNSIIIIKDTTVSVTISQPTANSVVNSANANNLPIIGTGEPRALVFVTISDTSSGTQNVITTSTQVGNNGNWIINADITSQSEGTIRIFATIVDLAGNTANSATVTVTKDTTVAVSISAPTNNQFIVSLARAGALNIRGFGDVASNVVVTVADTDPNTFDVISPTVQISPVGSWSVNANVTSLTDGTLSIVASATDAAGNNRKAPTVTLIKDTVVLPTTITTPAAGSTVTQAQASALVVSGTSEASARLSLRFSGTSGIVSKSVTASAEGTWTVTVNIATLPAGPITISGSSSDAAGNTGTITSITFTKVA